MAKRASKRGEFRGLSQVRKYLTKIGWKYVGVEVGSLHGLGGGRGVQWHWSSRQSADGRFVLFLSYSPHYVGPGKRAAAAEYLTRANWQMCFGNFEMDWSDGQVCFRTCIPLGAAGLREDEVEHLVLGNSAAMEWYLPGLLALEFGEMSAEEAFVKAERERLAAASGEEVEEGNAAQGKGGNGQLPPTARFSANEN